MLVAIASAVREKLSNSPKDRFRLTVGKPGTNANAMPPVISAAAGGRPAGGLLDDQLASCERLFNALHVFSILSLHCGRPYAGARLVKCKTRGSL